APALVPTEPPLRPASPRREAAEFVRTEGRWLAPVVLVVLMAIAIVIGVLQLSGNLPLTSSGNKAANAAGGAAPQQVSLQPGGVYKPNLGPGDTLDHPELVADAFSGQGKPWESHAYYSATFGGERSGIGIYGDLSSAMTLSKIEVDSPTPGWQGTIRYSTDGQNWSAPAPSVTAGSTQDFNVSADGAQRYWMVWITSLPQAYHFQVQISDIKAFH
ncbi:MAG: hypothetical protein ACRDJU_00890, partial [Actinomycetota bacterium]